MKLFSSGVLWSSALMLLSVAVEAQPYGQGPYGRQQDDRYSRGGYNGAYNNDERFSLIGRVLSDLDRAAENTRFDDRERKHFEEAGRQLEQFQDRWRQGKFDKGKIHETIEELDHLVNSDRLSRRDRQILARDREELRQFSSSRGRNPNYGYGDRDDRYNQNRRSDPNWR